MPATGLLSTGARSSLWLHWRARDLAMKALTGQLGVIQRASTSTRVASDGGTAGVAYYEPRFNPIDTDANESRETMALHLGLTGESFYLPWSPVPSAMTIYLKFVIRGTLNQVLSITNAANGNARFLLYSPSANNLQSYHETSGGISASGNLTTALSDICEARMVLQADGATFLGLTRNGGGESISTTSTTRTLAGNWAGVQLWLGGVNAAVLSDIDVITLKIVPGLATMLAMREAF